MINLAKQTRFTITKEIKLQVCQLGCFWRGLTEKVNSTIPWAGDLDWIKRVRAGEAGNQMEQHSPF